MYWKKNKRILNTRRRLLERRLAARQSPAFCSIFFNTHQNKDVAMISRNVFLVLLGLSFLAACKQTASVSEKDRLSNYHFNQVRLADGVPLNLTLNLRWHVADPESFYRQQLHPDTFQNHVMFPRCEEALRSMAHHYTSVDSVFLGQRERFLNDVKNTVAAVLGADGIGVKEVIVSELEFPESYTLAMEQAGLLRQEFERIRRTNAVELAVADADRRKAEAMARVQIAQEEANARIRDIQARTEERNRAAELAKAETEVQIEAKKAVIAADRQRQLNEVEIEKVAKLQGLELLKLKQADSVEVERHSTLARVYGDNPNYASFVVNKEMASKVNIAVVPAGTTPSVFDDLFKKQ